MRRLLNSNPHKLGPFLASPFALIAVLMLAAGGQGQWLPALALLAVAGLIYGAVVVIAVVDRALVERHQSHQ